MNTRFHEGLGNAKTRHDEIEMAGAGAEMAPPSRPGNGASVFGGE